MSNRVSFIPVCNSLDDLSVVSNCCFCRTFTDKMQGNMCNGCARNTLNFKENEILLLSYKPYWFHIATKKEQYRISWFDYLELENSILEITDNLNCVFYDKNNLFFYIDVNYINTYMKKVCETFAEVNILINKELHNFMPDKNLNHNFYSIFENVESTNENNRFLYLATEEVKKSHIQMFFSSGRHKLKSILREKFEFNIKNT